MHIIATLSEILHNCKDWDSFCDEFGYDIYACKMGGGYIEVKLTPTQAHNHGLITLSESQLTRYQNDSNT